MSAYEFPLFLDLIFSLITFVSRDSDLLVDSGEFTEILQMPVHGLVLDDRENSVVGKGIILVLAEDIASDIVQLNGDTITRFDCSNLNVVFLYVVFSKVIHVGVTQSGKAAE